VLGGLLLAAIIVGFGISEIVILTNGKNYVGNSQDCPIFPNATSFVAEKKIFSQWHWKYGFVDFDGSIQQHCPTIEHDVDVYINGHLLGRSDGKIFTTVTLTYINDCHGKTLYAMRTGDAWEALINGIRIVVSFELMDPTQTDVYAYIEGKSFFDDSFDIKDTSGNIVSHMDRQYFENPWTWRFTRYDTNHAGSDPLVMSIIAGHQSFTDDKDSTDACNSYFYDVGYILIAVLGLIFLVACVILYFVFKETCHGCLSYCFNCCRNCTEKCSHCLNDFKEHRINYRDNYPSTWEFADT